MAGREETQKKSSGACYVEQKRKKTEIFLLARRTRSRTARELKQTHKKLTGNVPRRLPLSSFKKKSLNMHGNHYGSLIVFRPEQLLLYAGKHDESFCRRYSRAFHVKFFATA